MSLANTKCIQTAVKVSLGPHRQTKDIQHLCCLLTCWCKSRRMAVMLSSRGEQTTQRRWNPLTAKWEKKDRKRECLVPSSCLVFYLFFPRLSLTKGKQQWTTWFTRGQRKVSFTHRVQTFPFFLPRSQVGRSQMLQADTRCHFWLKRWKVGEFLLPSISGWSRLAQDLLLQLKLNVTHHFKAVITVLEVVFLPSGSAYWMLCLLCNLS